MRHRVWTIEIIMGREDSSWKSKSFTPSLNLIYGHHLQSIEVPRAIVLIHIFSLKSLKFYQVL